VQEGRVAQAVGGGGGGGGAGDAGDDDLQALQINLNKQAIANTELLQYTRLNNTDIILIQEPHTLNNGEIPQHGYTQIGNSLSIILLKTGIHSKTIHISSNITAITINTTLFINVYASPNANQRNILPILQDIETIISTHTGPLIIAGDFNTGTSILKSTKQNTRAKHFDSFINSNNLTLHNYDKITWQSRGLSSITDYTLSRDTNIINWTIPNYITLSDHNYITFEVTGIPPLWPNHPKKRTDKELFKTHTEFPPELLPYNSPENTTQNAVTINNWIKKAVDLSTTTETHRNKLPYWNKNLEKVKRTIKQLTRKVRQNQNHPSNKIYRKYIPLYKKLYKTLIRQAKAQAWRNFVTLSCPWGKPYKVRLKFKPPPYLSLPIKSIHGEIAETYEDAYRLLLQDKFPSLNNPGSVFIPSPLLTPRLIEEYTFKPNNRPYPNSPTPTHICITPQDIKDILQTRNNKSAPGPDGIRYTHLKMINIKHPPLIADLATACIRHQIFPDIFKLAQVTLLIKPDKDPSCTNAYRPISLLLVLGKIIERTVADLINANLTIPPNTLYTHQYGFRHEHSCEMALERVCSKIRESQLRGLYTMAISFDIEAAFDSISYQAIIIGCQKLNLPHYLVNFIHSYVYSRKVIYNNSTHTPEKGCPQGSILGPLLWNIGYNPILEVISNLAHTTCFADDTLVILNASSIDQLQDNFDKLGILFVRLLSIIAVKPNIHKTEILFIPGTLPCSHLPSFTLQSNTIQSQSSIKYLGIFLDNKLSFLTHCKYLHTKSMKVINGLRPLMANKYGYDNKSRNIMLQGAIGSLWKYGSTIFSKSLFTHHNRKLVRQTHRQMLLLASRSYRTAPYLALTVINNSPPLEYQIHIRSIIHAHSHGLHYTPSPLPSIPKNKKRIKEARNHLNNHISQMWQQEWDKIDPNQNWTRSLIPKVDSYNGPTSFWITQMLTGHGSFGTYLNKYKKRNITFWKHFSFFNSRPEEKCHNLIGFSSTCSDAICDSPTTRSSTSSLA
jgi:hypothetical protein